jgi:F0F1-type ATP synthase delta subunit
MVDHNNRSDDPRIAVLESNNLQFERSFEKIDQVLEKLSNLCTSIDRMLVQHEVKISAFDTLFKDQANRNTAIEKRLELIEKWKYLVVGGAVAIGYIVSTVLHILR